MTVHVARATQGTRRGRPRERPAGPATGLPRHPGGSSPAGRAGALAD
jgi:hypothetical protein